MQNQCTRFNNVSFRVQSPCEISFYNETELKSASSFFNERDASLTFFHRLQQTKMTSEYSILPLMKKVSFELMC